MTFGNKQIGAALGKILSFGSGMKQPPGLSLALSPAMGACLIIALICALAWSFYMGFRVGRGEHPAEGLPAVAALVEKQESDAATGEEQRQSAPEAVPVQEQQAALTPAVPPIAQRVTPESAAPAPFTKPAGQGLGAWGPQDNAQPPVAPKKAPTAATKNGKQDKFIYTYQVAAVKNNRDAENLQKKLQGAGLKCSLRKSGKVVLAIVTLRGTETEARGLPQKLRGLKLGKPLLLSRKEIQTGTAKDKRKKK